MCSNCSGSYEGTPRPLGWRRRHDYSARYTTTVATAEEPTQVERLKAPKCDIATPEERIEQLCKSAAASYYHVHVCQQVENHIGSGDPLDLLLADAWTRKRENIKPRQL